MKHTKYWMTLALCAAMALSLAACGSKAPAQDSTKDTQQTEAEDTVIGGENAQIPDGYALSYIQALTERGLLEITYENESGDELSIRKAPGDGDISGDYNDYAQSDTITVSDREVTLKGNDDAVNLAIWAKDRYTYAVSASAGLSAEGMSELAAQIQ